MYLNIPFGDLELHGHSNIFFLGVNRSGRTTNSTANPKFYRALGQLHGPWCKQPLNIENTSRYWFCIPQTRPPLVSAHLPPSFILHSSSFCLWMWNHSIVVFMVGYINPRMQIPAPWFNLPALQLIPIGFT